LSSQTNKNQQLFNIPTTPLSTLSANKLGIRKSRESFMQISGENICLF